MKNYLILFLSAFVAYSSFSQTTNIKVFPEILKQKVESIGGNYCQANYTNNAWDAIGEATLEEFRPSHVRVALPLQFKKIEYNDFKGNKIVEEASVVSLLELMKEMKTNNGVSNFTVSVWRVADELVENPGNDSQRRIKKDKYNELIDMIEAFLLEAKNNYGVEVDYFSFNESDGGYQTIFSPEETIRFFKLAGDRFRKVGLKTKFLWADTAQTKGTVEFATMIAADSTIWKYLGPLCFHSWWSENIPNSEFERIANYAKAWNKEVWCSELGFDAMAWKIKGMNQSWDYAFRFAKISHRMLKHAEVSVSMYWTWQNNYGIMSADTKTKYPSYFVTRHQTDYFNNGIQVIHCLSSDEKILSLCGINKKGETILQLINLKEEAVKIQFSGINKKIKKVVVTTKENNWKEISQFRDNSDISLAGKSINTFIF